MFEFMQNISAEIYVFLVSMLPILELRFAIPLGAASGLNMMECYSISVIGNLIPIPFILIFIKKIIEYMSVSKISFLRRFAEFLMRKAESRSEKVNKYSLLGLFLFVMIPMPGTGAWTGALIAALMEMRIKKSLLSIILGVLVAGIIMTFASYGTVSFIGIFA